jgi:hypothetical protein
MAVVGVFIALAAAAVVGAGLRPKEEG